MRTRKEIEEKVLAFDSTDRERACVQLSLEVLLDIRDLLANTIVEVTYSPIDSVPKV